MFHFNEISTNMILFRTILNMLIALLFVNTGDANSQISLTAAQKLSGFSGSYGLGAGLGSLTLNDIGYDLSSSFDEACLQVGIKLGLSIDKQSNIIEQPEVDLAQLDTITLDKKLLSSIPITLNTEPVLSSRSDGQDFKWTQPDYYLTKLKNGYSLMSFSMGDRLSSKLTSQSPFITSKYQLSTPTKTSVSGYSSHIIHSGKSLKEFGESKVTFGQTDSQSEASLIKSVPELNQRNMIDLPLISDLEQSWDRFSFQYPAEYETALTKSYSSELNGGFGSLLTGSYGSILNNGYRTSQLITDGGLKGIKFLLKKK